MLQPQRWIVCGNVPVIDRVEEEARAAESLLQRGVDGLILATARDGDELPRALAGRGIAYVLALRTDGESPSAIGDDQPGGYLATRHLIDPGHRRIGIIAGPSYASSARGRLAGYRQAMAERGIVPSDDQIVESSFSIDAGSDAALGLMQLDPRPTAIFAVNDNTAIGAMSALVNLGLRVPDDVALVGYNDIPIVGRLPTPLTSVRVPFDQIATIALEMLIAGHRTKAVGVRQVAPTLIPRRSTGRVPMDAL